MFDGTNYLATWDSDFEGPVFGRRVSTGGSLLGVEVPISSGVRPALAAGAGLVLAVFESNEVPPLASIEGVRISAGTVLDDPPIPLTNPANNQVEPAIAFDGTNHLVVWADRRPASEYDLYAERVGGDGTKLDGAGIAVSTAPGYQDNPAVAFNGTEYFVVWTDARAGGSEFDIYGARVTPAGVVLDPGGIPIAATSSHETRPRVASDGNNFLVVWGTSPGAGIRGARVSPSGTVLDPSFLVITSAASAFRSAIAYGGGSYLVVWEQLARIWRTGKSPAPASVRTAAFSAPSSFRAHSMPNETRRLRSTARSSSWCGRTYGATRVVTSTAPASRPRAASSTHPESPCRRRRVRSTSRQ